MKLETRTTDGDVILRADAEGEPKSISGYAAVFYNAEIPGTEYQLFPGLVERIDPRAFGRAIAERDDVKALFNHEPDNLLARVGGETLELTIDGRGLRYDFPIDFADPDHVRVIRKIQRGDLTGSSFSFIVDEQSFEEQENGPDVRWIESVELWDVGPVTFPAYEATSVGARSSDLTLDAEEAWREWKLRKNERPRRGASVRMRFLELLKKRLTGSGGAR